MNRNNIQFNFGLKKHEGKPGGPIIKRILSFDCGYRSLAYALMDVKMQVDLRPAELLIEAIEAGVVAQKVKGLIEEAIEAANLCKIYKVGCIDICDGQSCRNMSFKELNTKLIEALDTLVKDLGALLTPGTEVLLELQPNSLCLDSYAVMCQVATYFAKDGAQNVNFIEPSAKLRMEITGGPSYQSCLARTSSKYAANKLFSKENVGPFIQKFGLPEILKNIPKSHYNHIGDAILQVLPACFNQPLNISRIITSELF